ncbi:hypothetical protein QRX50_38535 [Amycolatopsis carbonis]|uniref:PQQ-binding-like beta-propeller repeat protein n=1 Tax=Amycolatopsis carbonis TaxID=715471 RepID=A0A9Y2IDF5_9PSEU|nr:hypothetical protein [Amycolatopsis sp. 2-15]WIX77251.1 hypothetical protein QRX50_38535 [Amycolatopsis sp. 2-15]
MVTVRRVFAADPFTETGRPVTVTESEHHGLVAVAGRQGWREWDRRTRLSPHVVGLYDRRDLTCRLLLRSRFPVHAVDFHPRLPVLAIGTGRYGGGFFYNGELLLWHFGSGRVVSALADTREIRSVRWRRWREGRVLDLAVAPVHEEELGRESHTVGYDAMLERDDWLAVGEGDISWQELDGPCRESDDPRDETRAREHLEGLSAGWREHGAVWSVEALADGRIAASSEGVAMTMWSSVDGAPPVARPESRSLLDSATPDGREPPQGWTALPVRRASASYVTGVPDSEDEDRWVALVEPDRDEPTVRPLFPLAPSEETADLAEIGAAVDLDGGALIYAASWLRIGPALDVDGPMADARHAATLVTRRRLPDGEVGWQFVVGGQVLAIEADAAIVHLSLSSGLLVALDATTGGVLWTHPLVVAGLPSTGSALALAGTGRLLVGTAEGRVAECAVPARGELTAYPGAPAEGPVFRLVPPKPPPPHLLGFRAEFLLGGTVGGGRLRHQ